MNLTYYLFPSYMTNTIVKTRLPVPNQVQVRDILCCYHKQLMFISPPHQVGPHVCKVFWGVFLVDRALTQVSASPMCQTTMSEEECKLALQASNCISDLSFMALELNVLLHTLSAIILFFHLYLKFLQWLY